MSRAPPRAPAPSSGLSAAQLAVFGPASPAAAGSSNPERFLDEARVGVQGAEGHAEGGGGMQAALAVLDSGVSKRKKAQRFRDLTCPRTRTSHLADGTRIVTVGSHVLVYPAAAPASPPKEGAKEVPGASNAAAGSTTTFEEHRIREFGDDSFKHYSLGVGLYFKGVRLLATVFLVCAILQLPAMIFAVLANPSGTSESGLYFERTTVGNFGSLLTVNSTFEETWGKLPKSIDRTTMGLILSSIDTAVCLILLIFGIWLRRRQMAEAKAYSRREITVRKYTVEVSNLPPFFHDRLKLATWFETRFGKVVDVALAFEQHDLLDTYRSRGRLRKDIDMAVAHGETGKLDGMYDALARIDERIDTIQQDLLHRKTLCAYVTFEFQESRIACEKAFRNLWLRSLSSKFHLYKAQHDEDPGKTLLFGRAHRILQVTQAPEPSNIVFRNLKYSRRNKAARKCATGLATCVLIFVSVLAVYIAQRFQGESGQASNSTCRSGITAQEVQADPSLRDCFCFELGTSKALDSEREYGVDCSSYLTSLAISRALSVLSVVTICFVNFLLKVFVKGLSMFEKHHSLTRMQESIVTKLFIGLFLNTGIVLLVVNMQFRHYTTRSVGFEVAFDGQYEDLVYDWFVKVGAPIILTMIFNTINPHVWPLLRVPWRRWRREKCCLPSRSQSQSVWNQRFGGDEFELAERYAVMLNTLFVTLLYSGGMPVMLSIGAVTFCLTYLFDKISFLRLYRIPPRFDHSLAMYTTTLMPYAILLHLGFTLWFLTAPTLQNSSLIATSTSGDLLDAYHISSIADRISGYQTAPTLVLLVLVGAYIVVCRWAWGVLRACRGGSASTNADSALHFDASKFVPYSVARRTVTLETYHPHGSPFYHDAFLRTPSRKMMKIPAPLNVLAERARVAEAAAAAQAAAAPKQPLTTQQQSAQQSKQAAASIQTANANRSPVAAPPGVMQQLRASSGPTGSVIDEGDEVELISPTMGVGIDAAAPGLKKAESMGIDRRHSMKMTPEQLSAQKAAAKAVALENTQKFKRSGLKGAAAAADALAQHKRDQDLRMKASLAMPSPNALPTIPASPTPPLPSAQRTLQPSPQQQEAQQHAHTRGGGGGSRGSHGGSGRHAPTAGSEAAVAVVVLDIPDENYRRNQARVEEALMSPGEGLDDEAEAAAQAPFATHLQHHKRLSMPTEDPLLNQVQQRVHRMRSNLAHSPEESSKPKPAAAARGKLTRSGEDEGYEDQFPSGIQNAASPHSRKGGGSKADKKASSKGVADSSAFFGAATPVAAPQFHVGAVVRAESSSTTAAGDGLDPSGSGVPRHASPSTISEEENQLVPATCPNEVCARMLELVDTGEPQMVSENAQQRRVQRRMNLRTY